jgi:hypothetical protein
VKRAAVTFGLTAPLSLYRALAVDTFSLYLYLYPNIHTSTYMTQTRTDNMLTANDDVLPADGEDDVLVPTGDRHGL